MQKVWYCKKTCHQFVKKIWFNGLHLNFLLTWMYINDFFTCFFSKSLQFFEMLIEIADQHNKIHLKIWWIYQTYCLLIFTLVYINHKTDTNFKDKCTGTHSCCHTLLSLIMNLTITDMNLKNTQCERHRYFIGMNNLQEYCIQIAHVKYVKCK